MKNTFKLISESGKRIWKDQLKIDGAGARAADRHCDVLLLRRA
jgi:hypothetical protein